MNELDLLKLIKNNFANNSYIGDDTAYLEELGIVVTTDTLIEDVHFRLKTTTPFDLGFKSMGVNLSDIASDGAIPAYAFVSLSLPDYCDEKFVEEFYKGINEIALKYPEYGFEEHKGYGTKKHMDALKKYGPIKGLHRFSYKPVLKVSLQEMNLFDL